MTLMHGFCCAQDTSNVVENIRVEYAFRAYRIREAIFGSLMEAKSKKIEVLCFDLTIFCERDITPVVKPYLEQHHRVKFHGKENTRISFTEVRGEK